MTIAITGTTSMLGVAAIGQCAKKNIRVLAFVRGGSANMGRLSHSSFVTVLSATLTGYEGRGAAQKERRP